MRAAEAPWASSGRHGPGRLEPFVLISLALHAAVLATLPRWTGFERPMVPMTRGAVVQVVALPAPASPVVSTGARAPSAPGGSGLPQAAPSRPAAARVVAARPSPTQEPSKSREPAAGPSSTVPKPQVAQASRAPRSSEPPLTSERGGLAVAAASPAPTPPQGPAGKERPGEAGTPASGPLTRPESTGTTGIRQGNPPPGPPDEVPVSAVIAHSGDPPYPKNAISRGAQGRVVLELTVGADGELQKVDVSESSGDGELDGVARRYIQANWKLRPSPAGWPYRLRVEFRFAMDRDPRGLVEPTVRFRVLDDRVEHLIPR